MTVVTGGAACNVPQTQRAVALAAWVGLWFNIALSALKIAAGYFGDSQAVLADGVHSISDIISDLAIIIGVRYWSAPADANHPYGHRRIETLVTLSIGLCLGVVGVGIGLDALLSLPSGRRAEPKWIAFFAALLSIVVKEALYQWTASVGRRCKSKALIANAWHHRSDGLTSIPPAAAVALALTFPQFRHVDAIGAMVVAVFILQASWSVVWPALQELTDSAADAGTVEKIKALAMTTPGVEDVHAIRSRQLSGKVDMDMHIQVDPEITVQAGYEIAEAVRGRILQDDDVLDVLVHVEPLADRAPGTE